MNAGIEAIAHSFGATRIDNAAEGAKRGFDAELIRGKLGIATRYHASGDQATSDLAFEAAKEVLAQSGAKLQDIGALVVVTQTPDYQLPHTAALVQARLGLPSGVASFDISLGCSGWVYGASVLSAFMDAAGYRRALLVTADCYSKVIDPNDRATAPLFSDAAAATLLGEPGIYGLGKAVFASDGKGAESLIVKCGGSRAPAQQSNLHMDGRAIYAFMLSKVPSQVEQCLALNGLRLEDIDRFVFHQANHFMLESLRDRMGLPAEKVVIDVTDGGNTVGSTIPIALEAVLRERPARVLVSGFGVGLSWATNVLSLRKGRAP